MADTLYNAFKNIADAIRLKTGSSATMTPDEMVSAIGNISNGYNIESFNTSFNGTYTAENGHAYDVVKVTVPTTIESESLDILENGTFNANTGKAYSTVVVNVPQQGSESNFMITGTTEVQAIAQENIHAGDTVYLTGSGIDDWQDITNDANISGGRVFNSIINSSGTKLYTFSYEDQIVHCYDTTVTPWAETTITLASSNSNIQAETLYQFGDFGFAMFYDSDLDQKGIWIIDLNLSVLALTIIEQPILRSHDYSYQYRGCKALRQYGQRVFPNWSGGFNDYYQNTCMVINLQTQKIENYALDNGYEMYGISFISEDEFLAGFFYDYDPVIGKYRRSMSTVKDGAYECPEIWRLDVKSMIPYEVSLGDEFAIIYSNGKVFLEAEDEENHKHLYYLENVEQDDPSKVIITEITNLPEGFEFTTLVGGGDMSITPDFQKLLMEIRETSSKKYALAALDTKTLVWDFIGYISKTYGAGASMNSGKTLAIDGNIFKKDPTIAHVAHNGIQGSYSLGYSSNPVAKDQKGIFKIVYSSQ